MRRTILIVEDDPGIRLVLSMALEDEGYGVLEAEDGRVGLAVLERQTPDGMIVDLRMPIMDGVEFLHEVRRRGWQIPCIVATATAADEHEVVRCKVGAIVRKPFDIDDMLSAIRETCGPALGAA
jgi:DNA-binding response OmpR family regulator